MISVIIPAYNEEGYIGETLELILRSERPGDGANGLPPEVIVVANGCRDNTVAEAEALAPAFAARGWGFRVLDLEKGSKTGAMNAGSAAARHGALLFVDADIHVTPGLIAALGRVLDRETPCYASGRPRIRRAETWVSRQYARFWQRLPFMAKSVAGCGVYGVNGAGRARWEEIPEVISDDIFVRSHFTAPEMVAVPETYSWPIAEGLARLVRVRRRQNEGLEELFGRYPELQANRGRTAPTGLRKLALLVCDPLGFAVYAGVALAVRTPLFANRSRWERGRDTA
ncbi:glycosyltransferase [Pseudodonghicola flavimaris]|uniref:Glycosyltransferase n=1 Tax=Pseudodonghicola flavimaris TaxID=3050036 RepID=A0ABT7EWW5_9RHOB|nr:glycosyltransferase [Pseudodonghicola flavimaris]MDK3016775.1 glycosyltransferase [Pseudodonghicola flavimaris]